jgi:hypothetical protein
MHPWGLAGRGKDVTRIVLLEYQLQGKIKSTSTNYKADYVGHEDAVHLRSPSRINAPRFPKTMVMSMIKSMI